MPARILDGKATAAKVRREVAVSAQSLSDQGITPRLVVVLVGDDPASAIYVRNKERAAHKAGLASETLRLPATTRQSDLLEHLDAFNADSSIHGILVQLPLPQHMDASAVVGRVDPNKDVDGLHPVNAGLLAAGQAGMVPCTPSGVMRLLAEYGVELAGRRAVVVGRSSLVGRPVAQLLLHQHATLTICHSRTQDLAGEVGRAEILIAAVGKPELIRGEWLAPEAVVVDVGVHRRPDGSLCGDLHFESARERAGWISPVPGGVGPMTIAMLLQNTLVAARRQSGLTAS